MVTAPVELVHLGCCPTCGQQQNVAVACTCGHLVSVHNYGTRKGITVRTSCTNATCGCIRYEQAAQ